MGLWIAFALLIAVAGLAYRNIDAAGTTLGLVEHANQVLQRLQDVVAANSRVSAARRTYLITGDASQLSERESLDGRLRRATSDLRALLGDNPVQEHRLELFAQLVDQRLAALDRSVEQRRLGQVEGETAEGIALVARIRSVREEIEEEENRLLTERDARTRRDLEQTKVAELVGTSASLGLLLFVFRRLRAEVYRRRKSEEALRTAKDAADAANSELEAFSYSVAHDLRAPLRAIDGFGLALQEQSATQLGGKGLEYLDRVRSAAQRMGQLIDGLLGLSRVTRGELVRSTVDLTELARQSAARLRDTDPQRTVELVIADGVFGNGDPRLLTATLDNLLGNAWKFTRDSEHPRIEFGELRDGGAAVFFVRDNGAGFEPAYTDKLFGAFQRLHAASDFEGSGVGLATVQRIVRRHGGRIWAEGEVGRGATFFFTL